MKKYPLNPVNYYTRFIDMINDIVVGNEDKEAISWFTRKGDKNTVTLEMQNLR